MKLVYQLKRDPIAWLVGCFPICKWLPMYTIADLPYDIIAGITVGLTLLPVSLAYAQMAYLRPEFGLYSSFLGTFIYIFLGTSKDAIIGPSAIGSMLLAQFNVMNPLFNQGDNTYATILAMISGIIYLFVGIFKLGFIVNLFSIPVVSGFTSAAAFSIIASQLKSFVGIHKGPNDSPGVFVKQIKNIYDRRDEILMLDVTFGLISLSYLVAMEYGHEFFMKLVVTRIREPETERGKKIRYILLECLRLFVAARSVFVFVASTAIAYVFYIRDPKGTEARMTLVGYIKPGFPVPRPPHFQVLNTTKVWVPDIYNTSDGTWVEETVVLESTNEIFQKLSVGIIIIPLMGIMELFAILKAMGRKNGYRIDATQELLAIGLSNFLQSFYMSYPITAATAKTALNERCGVKSLLSTSLSIVIILVSIGCLTDVFYFVPKATLAAILIAAAQHLFDYSAAIHIWREYKPDIFLFGLTFLLCLFYDLAYGIVIAILINMVTFLKPIVSMHLCITREPLDIVTTGLPVGDPNNGYVTIVQLSHGLKYPSVDKFIDRITTVLASSDVHFVMDCRFVTGMDFTGLQAWRMLLQMVFKNKKHMIFTNLDDHVRDQLETIGLPDFRHAESIDAAIFEFSENVLGADNMIGVEEVEIELRRLQHTFSIVNSDLIMSRRASVLPDNVIVANIEPAYRGGATSVRVSVLGSTKNIAGNAEQDGAKEESRQEQEARLLKLMNTSTRPHLYDDIPLTIGSAGDLDIFSNCGSEHNQNPVAIDLPGGAVLRLNRPLSETAVEPPTAAEPKSIILRRYTSVRRRNVHQSDQAISQDNNLGSYSSNNENYKSANSIGTQTESDPDKGL